MKGLRQLIDLALSTPQPSQLVFASSIGILRRKSGAGRYNEDFSRIFADYSGAQPISESPVAAEVATGNGYVQSKWVAEGLLQEAANRTLLRPTIVRVGQICGGRTGVWNSNEWFPLIVRSSAALQAFPQDHRVCHNVPFIIGLTHVKFSEYS